MSSYIPFGKRYINAVIDNGLNPMFNQGNWTAYFTPDIMNLPQGQFEVIKGVITGGAPGAQFQVFNDSIQIDEGILGAYGSCTFYKASDAEFIVAGGNGAGTVYVYFSDNASDNLTPTVTLWLAYDQELDLNIQQFGKK